MLAKYEPQLAVLALSRLESAGALAQCLGALHVEPKKSSRSRREETSQEREPGEESNQASCGTDMN